MGETLRAACQVARERREEKTNERTRHAAPTFPRGEEESSSSKKDQGIHVN